MRVIFNGLPYFTGDLVDSLKIKFPHDDWRFFDTYGSFVDKVKFSCFLPFADLFFSFNGIYDQSGTYDFAKVLKKNTAVFWHGSDVLELQKKVEKDTSFINYLKKCSHFSDAPWLIEELNGLGISAGRLLFKYFDCSEQIGEHYDNPSRVVIYLPEGKEDFYGWQQVLELSQLYSSFEYHIVANTGEFLNGSTRPNIYFHGKLHKKVYLDLLKQSSILFRWVPHDGYSLSVIEAMGYGLEIVWTYDIREEKKLPFEQYKEYFRQAIERISKRNLKRNFDNIHWVKINADKESILNRFYETISNLIHEK